MKTHLIVSIHILLLLVALSPIQAGDVVSVDYLGSALWTGMNDVEIRGDLAYCAMSAGLMVYDISDLSQPTEVTKFFIEEEWGAFSALAIKDDLIYAVGTGGDLYIFDISTPTAPQLLVQSEVPAICYDIQIRNNYAYILGTHRDGGYYYGGTVLIYDLSNSTSPTPVGMTDHFGNVYSMDLSGDYAYLGGREDMYIIDISDPANALTVGSIHFDAVPDKSSKIYDVCVEDGVAYVALKHQEALAIVDVSNPAAPAELGRYTRNYYPPQAVTFINGNLYVFSEGSYKVVDVSDPADPQVIGAGGHVGRHNFSLDLIGDHLFVACADRGLSIHNIANPLEPSFVGEYSIQGSSRRLVIYGNYAYVAGLDNGLSVVDISNPANPTRINFDSPFDYTKDSYDIALKGDYLYISSREMLDVLSLADPSSPELVAQLAFPSSSTGRSLVIAEDFAYIRVDWNTVAIIDISVPESPTLAGEYDPPEHFESVAVSDDFLYVGCQMGLRAVDISSPASPVEVGYLPVTGPQILAMAIDGDYLYLSQDGSLVDIVNIADPANLSLVGSSGHSSDAKAILPVDNYVFLGEDRLEIYDVFNPSAPQQIEVYETIANVGDFQVVGDNIFTLTGHGFIVYSVTFTEPYYGDANGDESINVGDAVYLINYTFKNGDSPIPTASGDANFDGKINVGDAVYLINYIFKNGDPPEGSTE